MKLDLSELARDESAQVTVEVDEPCPPELGLDCSTPVKGKLRLTNTGSLLLVQGSIRTAAKFECSRCLVDFTLPIEADVEEEFRLERIGDAVRVLPEDEDDITSQMVIDNHLDLQELARQNLLLVLPIQPLCVSDCKGLCPTCGENLNVRQCACPPADVESPFSVLADLLEDESEDQQ